MWDKSRQVWGLSLFLLMSLNFGCDAPVANQDDTPKLDDSSPRDETKVETVDSNAEHEEVADKTQRTYVESNLDGQLSILESVYDLHGGDFVKARDNLKDFLQKSDNSDVLQALSIVLQNEQYNQIQRDLGANIVIDGKDSDWNEISTGITDSGVGDSPGEDSGDLLSFNWLFVDGIFYFVWKTAARPNENFDYVATIDFDGDDKTDFNFFVVLDASGKVFKYYQGDDSEGKLVTEEIVAQVSYGDVVEASVDIRQFPRHHQPTVSSLGVLPWTHSRIEASKTDLLPFFRRSFNLDNWALLLLLHPMEHDKAEVNDVIPFALALASNNLYDLADIETRALIREDILAHLDFYRQVVSWQEEVDSQLNLKDAPIWPKLFWADRDRYQHRLIDEVMTNQKAKLTSEIYLTFVDRVENLRKFHAIIKDQNLIGANDLETAGKLEDFVHANRFYVSSMENLVKFEQRGSITTENLTEAIRLKDQGLYEVEHFGIKRRWDGMTWLNHQLERFENQGAFFGDCGTATVVQMAFYRAAGLAPVSIQWHEPEEVVLMTHNAPGFYRISENNWQAVQKPTGISAEGNLVTEGVKIEVNFHKPYFHHLRQRNAKPLELVGSQVHDVFYPGESTDSTTVRRILEEGIPNELFTGHGMSDTTYVSGGTLFK